MMMYRTLTVKRTIQPLPYHSWTFEASVELEDDADLLSSTRNLIGYVDQVCDDRLDGRLPFDALDDEKP
jgi:hypothetical protein